MGRRGRLYAKVILKAIYSLKILPRWVIVLIDISLIGISTVTGYLLRFNFEMPLIFRHDVVGATAMSMLCGVAAIIVSSSYKGIVRHTGLQDSVRIFVMLAVYTAMVIGGNLLFNAFTGKNLVPFSVILISFFASFLFLFNYRLLVKYVFSVHNRNAYRKSNVLIYGAGNTGMITRAVVQSNMTMRVIGFVDNDSSKVGKVLNGAQIFDARPQVLRSLFADYRVDELIITVKDLTPEVKTRVVELCLEHDVKVRVVPPIEKWVRGELSINQIKEIKIEDLLEREAIRLDNENLKEALQGKRICVTGAAGSIGSEIVRQLASLRPSALILIDQAESGLFEIEREIGNIVHATNVLPYVADITNKTRIEQIFASHLPEVVFHAAAYKHVPMMENNACEAITCNILGTKHLADLSIQYNVQKFVMVSTDKAVNPTNVMGCSKRIAEIYVQALNNHLNIAGRSHTAFVTTRFGNVMGSSGSVIPTFKKQIEQGGPVTVTHPEITRFFMTIPEACRLVLEAGVMGSGGEIFIFDMGESVKVLDMAKKMIQLSGLKPGKDIDIVFTGLRDGEKLYEELLTTKENTIPTHHEKIMIARVPAYPFPDIDRFVNLFYDLVDDRNELKMVALMKELVPEFKSNYSRFEILDDKSLKPLATI